MTTAIIIPARYGSSRLPGKPLLRETGRYLIQHVYEQACRVGCASEVLVATDDERIARAVAEFGGRAVMTNPAHPSGTDRIAEVAQQLACDRIINIQGDEPQFDPGEIDQLDACLAEDPDAGIATLAVPIRDLATYLNPNCVKVVQDDRGRALYFSRSPIPMVRDGEPDFDMTPPRFLLHLGVYAYRRQTLLELAAMPPHPLEELEKLEQLRYLARGGIIRIRCVAKAHRGVDTPEDYAAFVRSYHETRSFAA